MNTLNLYSGIGGNRQLWKGTLVTAVEWEPDLARIYKEYFPDDRIIMGDAHEFLLRRYRDYDFIWSSPPCQSHSRARFWRRGKSPIIYPDMKLWKEILFLQNYAECLWAVENVVSYYKPLIEPTIKLGRHCIWSNFPIRPIDIDKGICPTKEYGSTERFGFTLQGHKVKMRRDQVLRNLVDPVIGNHVLEEAKRVRYGK